MKGGEEVQHKVSVLSAWLNPAQPCSASGASAAGTTAAAVAAAAAACLGWDLKQRGPLVAQ